VTAGRDGDDPRDTSERPRKSWREIDAARNRSGSRAPSERRPTNPAAQQRAAAATKQYLRELDGALFSKEKGGAEAERLAKAVREAHGTPGLAPACRNYQAVLGVPEDPALLAHFLDAQEPALLIEILDALLERAEAGKFVSTSGLRTQLRLLGQSAHDDVAERAEDLLARL